MENFIDQVNKLLKQMVQTKEEAQYCDGDLKQAIANARINGLFTEIKDSSVYVNRYKDSKSRECLRVVYQLRTQNNAKVKNIETLIKIIRQFECYFISIDKINVLLEDNMIYLDVFRLGDFCERITQ